jgi:hypothetical protein
MRRADTRAVRCHIRGSRREIKRDNNRKIPEKSSPLPGKPPRYTAFLRDAAGGKYSENRRISGKSSHFACRNREHRFDKSAIKNNQPFRYAKPDDPVCYAISFQD